MGRTHAGGTPPEGPADRKRWFRMPALTWLLAAVPVAIGLELFHAVPLWVFIVSCLAIIPLAGLMGRATESLAHTLGAGVGGLLNATFGNAAELIIALMLLRRGPAMYPLIKASLTGSIIGNVLLVLGAAMVAGGMRHKRQEFNRTAAGMGSTLMALASIGLIVPTIYFYVFRVGVALSPAELHRVESISLEIAIVLAITYALSLVFTLKTHSHLFAGPQADPVTGERPARGREKAEWGRGRSLAVLLGATAGVALISEFLVGSVEAAAHSLGLNAIFIGVIVVAIIGNAAEHSTALLMAMKNKMDLAFNIAVGSSLQIALFVAPVLVFVSMGLGHGVPLDLHFSAMETIAIVIAILALALVSNDGECHWMEGVMLLAVYVILGLAFYNLPPSALPVVSSQ